MFIKRGRLGLNNKTISELLFERFCNENNILWCPIETKSKEKKKTPDYELKCNEQKIIAEIKQFDSNKEDKRVREESKKRDFVGYWEESGRRIRLKIKSALPQLRKLSNNKFPAIIVLYDNVPIESLDPGDIKSAMYGEEKVTALVPEGTKAEPIISYVGFGGKRMTTPQDNRTLSAIAHLYKFQNDLLRIRFYHNIYAHCPLDPNYIRGENIKHFTLLEKTEGKNQEWYEI